MILDCHADHALAMLYDVLDLDSGRWLTDEPITYVDDEAGVYIVLLRDAKGNYYLDPNNPDEVAREERRSRIKCCLKPEYESEEQGLALRRAEMELTRIEVDEERARERKAQRERDVSSPHLAPRIPRETRRAGA